MLFIVVRFLQEIFFFSLSVHATLLSSIEPILKEKSSIAEIHQKHIHNVLKINLIKKILFVLQFMFLQK